MSFQFFPRLAQQGQLCYDDDTAIHPAMESICWAASQTGSGIPPPNPFFASHSFKYHFDLKLI